MFWLVLAFLGAVAVLYIQIARVAAWGGPPLWPVAVGVVALVTICVVGFTAGALFPGRFTAPLVAVGAVVLHLVGTHALSPAARHAWLAAHLPALRAGHITPAQIP